MDLDRSRGVGETAMMAAVMGVASFVAVFLGLMSTALEARGSTNRSRPDRRRPQWNPWFAVGPTIVVGAIVWWPSILLTTALVVGGRRKFSAVAATRHRAARAAVLPEVIDLVSVTVGSGGTIHEAIRVASVVGPETVTADLCAVLEEARAGRPLREAMQTLPLRLGETYRPLVAALLASERDGAPLALLLTRLGAEARSARRIQAEIRARRLPVQLLFPLVVCSLPALLVGAVLPLLLLSFRSL
jgi:Flp pilus assembly protein TadB